MLGDCKLALRVVVLCLLAQTCLIHTQAQDDLTAVPNRPTVSNPAQPVQPGVLETEWGVDAAESHQDINGLKVWRHKELGIAPDE